MDRNDAARAALDSFEKAGVLGVFVLATMAPSFILVIATMAVRGVEWLLK